MRKPGFLAIAAVFILATQAFAFDMGSMLKSAAPLLDNTTAKSTSESNSLLDSITSSLGVTSTQAAGGAAALLGDAKTKMDPTQFLQLSNQAPAIGSIMQSDYLTSITGGSSVESQFNALGMDSSMISQFAPIIMEYAKGYVSPEILSALSGALSF